MGIQHAGIAAWQSCQQLETCRRNLPGLLRAEKVAAPGCVQCSRRVFAEAAPLVELVSVTKRTAMFFPQGHSQTDMHLRVALHLHPASLSWTMPINLKRCLKVHFVEQALNSSVCQVTFTIPGRGPVKTAKDLWKSTSCAQKSQPYSTPPLPLCSLKLHVASTATHENWQRSFS